MQHSALAHLVVLIYGTIISYNLKSVCVRQQKWTAELSQKLRYFDDKTVVPTIELEVSRGIISLIIVNPQSRTIMCGHFVV